MSHSPSTAERVDHAVDQLVGGASPSTVIATSGLSAAEQPLVAVAALVRTALPLPPVAPRFEARLGARLAGAVARRDPMAWALRHPGRLIVTGAVGSAVTVGVTAYAVWRSSARRSANPAQRLLQR